MSKSNLELVKEFHVATSSPVLPSPGIPPHDRIRLRAKLLLEESMEAVGAMLGFGDDETKALIKEMCDTIDHIEPRPSLPSVMKELDDVEYVTHGARLEFGLPESSFEAVHRNNMSKIGGEKRADGKQLKPVGYVKFDAAKFLAENGWAN